MLTATIIILWMLSGILPFIWSNNAFQCNWYREFKTHYKETEWGKDDDIFMLIFGLVFIGPFSWIAVLKDLFNNNKDNSFYWRNNITGFWYNKKKVERFYNNK